MSILLVDIGNTRIKWGCCKNGQIELLHNGAVQHRGNGADFKQKLSDQWKQLPKFDKALLICVGDARVEDSVVTLINECGCNDIRMISRAEASACGVSNAYPQPQQLGVDRWISLLAAHRLYSGDKLIVNCGTAVTLDFLQADGQHRGGYIIPGIALMRDALCNGTRDLPAVIFADEPMALNFSPANNTVDAIHDGIILSMVAMIEKVIRQTQALGFKDVQCLLTGGAAERVMANLNLLYHYDAGLVLKGLAVLANTVD